MMQRIALEPAFILHTRPYSNTSLILELFSEHHGRVAVIARSARGSKSRYRGKLLPFSAMLVSWSGRTDLKALGAVDFAVTPVLLEGDALLCGFYINELMLRLLQREDAYPNLYQDYANAIKQLMTPDSITITLRRFEKSLLDRLGYGLPLHNDANSHFPIEANVYYQHIPQYGFVRCDEPQEGLFMIAGQSLIDIRNNCFEDPQTLSDAKKLFRRVLSRHLGDKPLKSRELFS